MARPKSNPNEAAPPKNHVEAVERGSWTVGGKTYTLDVSDIDPNTPDDPVVAQKIDFAEKVLAEKAEVLGRIGAVRELLTLLIQTGSGSQDQVAWVRFNLPRKTKRESAEEEPETAEATAEAA